MFAWVGELAEAFASIGPWGVVLLAMLIIVLQLIRSNRVMHDATIKALDRSSDAHTGVMHVLGRIEGMLGMPPETNG